MPPTEVARVHSETGPSGRHRWRRCPGQPRLARSAPRGPPSRYAQEGTRAHEAAAAVLAALNAGRVPRVPAEFAELQGYLGFIAALMAVPGGSTLEVEVALSHPTDQGYHGTADALVFEISRKRLHVIDLKWGAGVMVDATTYDGEDGVPALNEQLEAYAPLAVRRFPGAQSVQLHIYQPRGWRGDDPIRSSPVISRLDLDLCIEPQVLGEIAATRASDAPLVPGDHCRWCPAAMICSAQKSVFESLVEETTPVAQLRPFPEELRHWLGQCDVAEARISAIRDYAQGLAETGILIPGYTIEAKLGARAWDTAMAAETVLERLVEITGLPPGELRAEPRLLSAPQVLKKAPSSAKLIEEELIRRSYGAPKLRKLKPGEQPKSWSGGASPFKGVKP